VNILTAEKISKSYSEKILFEEISIGISEGEKIGLIGINGTGKSTLLKVIAGVESPDKGSIISGSSVKIEYLSQNPTFENKITVLKQIFKGDSPIMNLLMEYEYILQKFNANPDDSQLERKLIILTQHMDIMKAWTIENEAKTMLTKLGIFDFNAEIGTLSGGQKKRVAVASALISPSDLLILDEPTNHIDNDTVDWLENFLNKRKGSLLMVTHDRYFLERVANKIIELDNGRLYTYKANYSKFLEMKVEREELEQSSEQKRQSLLRTELEWIRKGAKARTTKQKARINRFEELKEELAPAINGNIEIKAGSSRLGKKTIVIEHICKSFSNVDVIHDFTYILLRDDRIGIIGPNGCGKSTLLKLIAGKLNPDSGTIAAGETVKIGLFSQESEEMDESLRVIDYIREEAEYLTTNEGSISASQLLERFLFPPSVQWTPIAKLSGGEKRRLYLLRILMSAPNILLLDEPTNDLDIQTLTILESYLDEFPGVVIVVSHDRYFLDRIAEKIFSFEGNGIVKQFAGNYSDYHNRMQAIVSESVVSNCKNGTAKKSKNIENNKSKPLKLTFKEQKEFEQIDEVIAGLENELSDIIEKINQASSDFELLEDLIPKRKALEIQLNKAIERWSYLNELVEEISKNKKNT